MQSIRGLLALGVFFALPFLCVGYFSVSAAVVINEMLPKPSDEISEWIELYNNGPDQVALDGWRLENSVGDKKVFTFISGTNIPPGGFLTIFQSQTGISLNNNGDSVKLSDANNNQIDNQSFPGTLGYNYSMGRSTDGSGGWTPCTTQTPNFANNCPLPPTPLPTAVPTNTPLPIPTATPAPTDLPMVQTTAYIVPTLYISPTVQPNILGTTNKNNEASPSPDTIQFALKKSLIVGIVGIGALWTLVIFFILWRKRK